MNDESSHNRPDITDIAKELSAGKLSRRGLVERLKVAGLGFGAAFALGVAGAHAAAAPDTAVTLTSTNAALNSIIQAPQSPAVAIGKPLQQEAYYRRFFRRFYHRIYMRHYGRY